MTGKRISDKRFCLNCNSKTTQTYGHYEKWHKYKDGFLCHKCYNRLISNPKSNPKWKPRQLYWTPKGQQIIIKENPRKRICQNCGKKGYTHIHHFGEYYPDDPLKDTIELCPSCHAFESWKFRKDGLMY